MHSIRVTRTLSAELHNQNISDDTRLEDEVKIFIKTKMVYFCSLLVSLWLFLYKWNGINATK